MLFNQLGQPVKLHPSINSKEHPHRFVDLRETKDPLPPKVGNMFHIETRARWKQ